MAKGWYVIHAYSGHENKVEAQIRKIMTEESFKEHIFDVKVPAEEVVTLRDGKKRITSKKFLPGYVLVEGIEVKYHIVVKQFLPGNQK